MSDQQPRRARRAAERAKASRRAQAPSDTNPPPPADPAPEPAEAAPRGQSEVDRLLLAGAAQVAAGQQGAAADAPPDLPEPDPLATAWTELDLRCPTCNITHYAPTCTFLNAEESPRLLEGLANDRFNLQRCPLCRKIEPIDYPFTVYLPQRKLAVQVRSEWEYHAGGGEEWYAARLEDFFERWAEYDVRIDVVFGQDTFRARYGDEVAQVLGGQADGRTGGQEGIDPPPTQ